MPLIDIDGIRYNYAERGSGPLLLFGHSTFLDHRLFDGMVESLSARYRCVAVDWPGHGASGWNPEGWTLDDVVQAVPGLVHALGEDNAVMIGVSAGAAIFLRAALAFPQVARGLVYMSARADPHAPENMANVYEMALKLRDGTEDERRAILSSGFMETLMHSPGWRAANPDMAAHELAIQLSQPRAALPLIARALGTMSATTHRLGEVQCPVLSLFGAADPGIEWAQKVAKGVPEGNLCIIPGAGHHLPFDAPDATLAAVREFVDSLHGASRSHSNQSSQR